jgi:hypothetical protein
MRKAILTESFAWVCESCGAMNHVHAILLPLTPEQLQEIMESIEIDDDAEISAITHPSIVVCPLCKESFETVLEDQLPE